ncbi:MAG TPA: hypothetical protein VLC52_08355, partial [Anaerolineae bacterium]|nr:hypothetical protein [Anaerolineae bacterium]
MAAWAALAVEVGALLGQVGLALSLAPEGRAGLWRTLRDRATLLDETTRSLFGLRAWLDGLWQPDPND